MTEAGFYCVLQAFESAGRTIHADGVNNPIVFTSLALRYEIYPFLQGARE